MKQNFATVIISATTVVENHSEADKNQYTFVPLRIVLIIMRTELFLRGDTKNCKPILHQVIDPRARFDRKWSK